LTHHFYKKAQRGGCVVNKAYLDVLLYLVQEKVDEGGLAGADFPRNNDEPLVFRYGIFKEGVGVFMALAHEEIIRVRVEIKGLFS